MVVSNKKLPRLNSRNWEALTDEELSLAEANENHRFRSVESKHDTAQANTRRLWQVFHRPRWG